MRILYVCHRFPFPPRRGGKIRPFNMIRHLAGHHEVHVASLAHDAQDLQEAAGIAPYCASFVCERPARAAKALRMFARLPTLTPSAMGYFHSPSLQRAIDDLARRIPFDLIFVHCAFVAPYVTHLDVPKILDFGDLDSQKWLAYSRFKPFPLSAAYRIEGHKMHAAERRLAGRFDCCTATTRGEFEALEDLGTARATGWFPNGVDAAYFAPADAPEHYERDLVTFVGRMDYYPNQEAVLRFVERVWPIVRSERTGARLQIVGASPPASISALARQPGVQVTGTVPDVRDFVRSSALTVAPLAIARGVQNKILESMCMGVPVVASSQAAKGVDAVPDRDLLVADEPAAFAVSMLKVMTDPAERRRLADAGRTQVGQAHDWQQAMKRLDAIIARTVGGG